MAKRLEYEITTDASKGIKGVKDFAAAVKKAMDDIEGSSDGATTSAQKLAKAYSQVASQLETQLKGAAQAADALAQQLGPELTARTDLDQVVVELNRLGLSFDEITADSEALAASLRDLDRVALTNVEVSAQRTKTGVDEIGRSADSSRSALANMIGNSAQDIGNIGGAAGSTGVLIGQMAEYMADAALEGESFIKVISNFAAVAGPAAALGVAIATVTGYMQKQSEAAAASAENMKAVREQMAGAADDAVGLSKGMRDSVDELRNFDAGEEILGNFVNTVNEVGRSIPLLGRLYQDTSVDIINALDKTGLSVFKFNKAVVGGEAERQQFLSDLEAFRDAAFITDDEFKGLRQRFLQQADAVDKARKAQHLMNVSLEESNALIKEIALQDNPFAGYQDAWNALMADLRDGQIDAAATTKIINALSEALGKDPQEVISLALGKIGDANEAAREQIEANIEAIKEWTQNALEGQQSVNDLADVFDEMGRRVEALSAIFELGDAALESASDVRDIRLEIEDLDEAAKDVDLSKTLDPSNLKADKLLDAFDQLRPQIQAKITETFAASGADEAKKTAESYVNEIYKELGGRLSKDEIRKLLGLEDLDVKLKVAVDHESLATATALLEVLTGVGGNDPWTAQIQLDLAAGNISADAAKILIAERLKGLGIDVPTNLLPPPGSSMSAATSEANRYMGQHPATMPVKSGPATGLNKTLTDAQRILNEHPLTATVITKGGSFFNKLLDAGGTAPSGGGLAGERRPEIINGRYLITSPTVVPPGTRVTSGARTARILRTRGTRGLRRYDAGGVVAGPSTVNVNIKAGVIGNRYDVMRTVEKAARDKQRLLGARG